MMPVPALRRSSLGLVRDCLRVDLRVGAKVEADRLEDDERPAQGRRVAGKRSSPDPGDPPRQLLALSARRVRGGPSMEAWPITQSAGVPR